MNRRLIGILAALCFVSPALRAELSLETTHGPDRYTQNTLNFDMDVSRKVNIGLGYNQSSSDYAPTASKTYSASVGVKAGGHGSVRGTISNTPEANGHKATGWGASASYGRWSETFAWTLSAACNQSFMSEYWESQTTVEHFKGKNPQTTTITSTGWERLLQTGIGPSFYADLFGGRISFGGGYSIYGYDRDVRSFSDALATAADPVQYSNGNNSYSSTYNYGNLPSLLSGFPDHILSAGISVCPLKQLRLGYDWSRTGYVLDAPVVYSSTYSAAYTFFGTLRPRLSCSFLSTDETYVTLGMQVLWQ